jgi:hypothetical protein
VAAPGRLPRSLHPWIRPCPEYILPSLSVWPHTALFFNVSSAIQYGGSCLLTFGVTATQNVDRDCSPRGRSDIGTITQPDGRCLSLRGVVQITIRPSRSTAVSCWVTTGSQVSSWRTHQVNWKLRRLSHFRWHFYMWFGVLTAVTMKITVFWDVRPCSLVDCYQRSGKPCYFNIIICTRQILLGWSNQGEWHGRVT